MSAFVAVTKGVAYPTALFDLGAYGNVAWAIECDVESRASFVINKVSAGYKSLGNRSQLEWRCRCLQLRLRDQNYALS